jgi:cytochrome c oxidase subunit II
MLGIGVVCGAITAAIAVFIPWLPEAGAKEAGPIDDVYWLVTIISIVIFALVAGVSIYSVFRFRAAPDDEEDGEPIHGNTRLEIAWTAVPTALVTAIAVYSGIVLTNNEDVPSGTRVVNVTAQQFAWSFSYAGEKMPASGELVLPVDKPVRLVMTSKDVIHSFWVPQWRLKQDVVPGIQTKLLITPDRLGTYDVVCTELCGLGHSTMRAQARVLTAAAFKAWVRERKRGVSAGGATQAKELFTANCGSCHALSDAGTSGQVGPKLDEALRGKDKAFIRESIVDPNKVIASGYHANVMPQNFGEMFSDAQLNSLVDYLAGATSKGH